MAGLRGGSGVPRAGAPGRGHPCAIHPQVAPAGPRGLFAHIPAIVTTQSSGSRAAPWASRRVTSHPCARKPDHTPLLRAESRRLVSVSRGWARGASGGRDRGACPASPALFAAPAAWQHVYAWLLKFRPPAAAVGAGLGAHWRWIRRHAHAASVANAPAPPPTSASPPGQLPTQINSPPCAPPECINVVDDTLQAQPDLERPVPGAAAGSSCGPLAGRRRAAGACPRLRVCWRAAGRLAPPPPGWRTAGMAYSTTPCPGARTRHCAGRAAVGGGVEADGHQ
jgi:hypothetical protein